MDECLVDLQFTSDGKVYAANNIKKFALKVFPMGMLSKSKSAADEKGKVVITVATDNFIVQPPKNDRCIVPFFWVGHCSEEGLANMEHFQTKVKVGEKQLTVPGLRNRVAVKAHDELILYKAPEKGLKRKA